MASAKEKRKRKRQPLPTVARKKESTRMLPTGCRKAEGGASMVPTGFSEAGGKCKDGVCQLESKDGILHERE